MLDRNTIIIMINYRVRVGFCLIAGSLRSLCQYVRYPRGSKQTHYQLWSCGDCRKRSDRVWAVECRERWYSIQQYLCMPGSVFPISLFQIRSKDFCCGRLKVQNYLTWAECLFLNYILQIAKYYSVHQCVLCTVCVWLFFSLQRMAITECCLPAISPVTTPYSECHICAQ